MSRGPLWMFAASASFTVMITLVKVARGWDLSTLELMGWRSYAAIPLLVLLLGHRWRITQVRMLLLRSAFGTAAMFFYFASTAGLGVGEVQVLSQLQPVWVALLAPLILGSGERAGRAVWVALALGLLGTATLAWPALGESEVRMLSVVAALFSAFFSALAHTCLRGLRDEDGRAVVFWFQVFVGVAAAVAVLGTGGPVTVPAWWMVPALIGIGATALYGQIWLTRAYSIDTAAKVAAAAFVSPLMGFFVDAAWFGRPPTVYSLVGGALIVGAGAVLLRDRG